MAMSIVAVMISDRLHVLTHKLLRPKRSITAWIIFRCTTTFSAPFMGLSFNTMRRNNANCPLSESRIAGDSIFALTIENWVKGFYVFYTKSARSSISSVNGCSNFTTSCLCSAVFRVAFCYGFAYRPDVFTELN